MITQYYNLTKDQIQDIIDKLSNYTGYVPLLLLHFTHSEYFEKISDEVNMELFIKRNNQPTGEKRTEYLKEDFEDWLRKNKEFQTIF